MAGPYPPNHGTGSSTGSAQQPHAGPHPGYPTGPPAAYPAPIPYPRRPHRRLVVAGLVAAAMLVLAAAVIGYATRDGRATTRGSISQTSARTAIQGYLNALADRDIDTIARNALCGIYDAVTDHRSDNAVAKMASDAFHRQFSQTEVTSVDKIVSLSDYQAQALFTVRVTRVSGDQRHDHTQGVAQLLSVDDHILVCSYELRTAAGF